MGANGELDLTERVKTAPTIEEPLGLRVSWKSLLGTLALLAFAATGLTFAWTAATAFNEKAPKAAVHRLEQRHVQDVHRLEMGLYGIQRDQRTIMRAVAPMEEAALEPLPPPPELKPFPEAAE